MNGTVFGADPSRALLILLVAGHFLGDFLFQTRRMAADKVRLPVLGRHALAVVLTHLTVLMPLVSWLVAGTVVGIGLLHALIDAVTSRWQAGRPRRLGLFLLDQSAHLVVVLLAWLFLWDTAGVPQLRVPAGWLDPWLLTSVLAAAFALNWTGGSTIVSAVLEALVPGLEEREERSGVAGGGRLIGILERTLTLILILFGQWGAVALLVTAKSVARFEELKERHFAEYYLVGTLTSLLVAVVIGVGLKGLGI